MAAACSFSYQSTSNPILLYHCYRYRASASTGKVYSGSRRLVQLLYEYKIKVNIDRLVSPIINHFNQLVESSPVAVSLPAQRFDSAITLRLARRVYNSAQSRYPCPTRLQIINNSIYPAPYAALYNVEKVLISRSIVRRRY
jgi:hypothetical protein